MTLESMLCEAKFRCIARGLRGLMSGWLALGASFIVAPAASASDPSWFLTELVTPSGWEICSYGGEQGEPVSSVELRIPAGWDTPSLREEPRWAGVSCSEVIVPLDWAPPTTESASHHRARRAH